MFQVLSKPKKRRLEVPKDSEELKEQNNMLGSAHQSCSRTSEIQVAPLNFLRLPGNGSVYHCEQWKDTNSMLYTPVTQDLMINLRSIEQLSFAKGSFFVADEKGVYKSTEQGCAINLWRYSESERRIFISRSLLITNEQVFDNVRQQLENA